MPGKNIGYIRVSTVDQHTERHCEVLRRNLIAAGAVYPRRLSQGREVLACA